MQKNARWMNHTMSEKHVSVKHDGLRLPETQKSVARRVLEDVTIFEPRPMTKPQVDDNFENMTPLERCVECVRYIAQRLLYWLSPGGVLREWWRMWWRILWYGLAMIAPVWVLAFVAERVMRIMIYVTITWVLVAVLLALIHAVAHREQR